MIPVLLEHKNIIGRVLSVEIDEIGVKFTIGVREDIDNKLDKHFDKYLDKYLSIGFQTREFYRENGIRVLKSIDIKEISLVSFPAQGVEKCQKI